MSSTDDTEVLGDERRETEDFQDLEHYTRNVKSNSISVEGGLAELKETMKGMVPPKSLDDQSMNHFLQQIMSYKGITATSLPNQQAGSLFKKADSSSGAASQETTSPSGCAQPGISSGAERLERIASRLKSTLVGKDATQASPLAQESSLNSSTENLQSFPDESDRELMSLFMELLEKVSDSDPEDMTSWPLSEEAASDLLVLTYSVMHQLIEEAPESPPKPRGRKRKSLTHTENGDVAQAAPASQKKKRKYTARRGSKASVAEQTIQNDTNTANPLQSRDSSSLPYAGPSVETDPQIAAGIPPYSSTGSDMGANKELDANSAVSNTCYDSLATNQEGMELSTLLDSLYSGTNDASFVPANLQFPQFEETPTQSQPVLRSLDSGNYVTVSEGSYQNEHLPANVSPVFTQDQNGHSLDVHEPNGQNESESSRPSPYFGCEDGNGSEKVTETSAQHLGAQATLPSIFNIFNSSGDGFKDANGRSATKGSKELAPISNYISNKDYSEAATFGQFDSSGSAGCSQANTSSNGGAGHGDPIVVDLDASTSEKNIQEDDASQEIDSVINCIDSDTSDGGVDAGNIHAGSGSSTDSSSQNSEGNATYTGNPSLSHVNNGSTVYFNQQDVPRTMPFSQSPAFQGQVTNGGVNQQNLGGGETSAQPGSYFSGGPLEAWQQQPAQINETSQQLAALLGLPATNYSFDAGSETVQANKTFMENAAAFGCAEQQNVQSSGNPALLSTSQDSGSNGNTSAAAPSAPYHGNGGGHMSVDQQTANNAMSAAQMAPILNSMNGAASFGALQNALPGLPPTWPASAAGYCGNGGFYNEGQQQSAQNAALLQAAAALFMSCLNGGAGGALGAPGNSGYMNPQNAPFPGFANGAGCTMMNQQGMQQPDKGSIPGYNGPSFGYGNPNASMSMAQQAASFGLPAQASSLQGLTNSTGSVSYGQQAPMAQTVSFPNSTNDGHSSTFMQGNAQASEASPLHSVFGAGGNAGFNASSPGAQTIMAPPGAGSFSACQGFAAAPPQPTPASVASAQQGQRRGMAGGKCRGVGNKIIYGGKKRANR